ncbi:MAG: hypothetical protein HMLKMBBP_01050 [Planctomycetes bacterium]|nr:hypothetical protein [Planctomycetota bacterium]
MRLRLLLPFLLTALPASAQEASPPESPAKPPPRLLGPRSGPERKKAASRFGATAASEKAVVSALDWLARHQEPDGSWDADGFDRRCAAAASGGTPCDGRGKGQHGEDVPCPFDDAISALATLAFLGNGHLPGVEGDPHGAAVAKALDALRGGDAWSLPLTVECFAEAEAMEGKGRFAGRVASGVERLLAMRQEDGAWGYAAPWRPGSDVPHTALVVSALVAARDCGTDLPADLGARVDAWLSRLEEKGGKLAYLEDGRKYGYTPTTSNAHCAFAMRELLEAGTSSARHRAHAALVASETPAWKISFREVDGPGRGKVSVQVGNLSMYQWLYGTVGAFQRGGDTWTTWFGAVKTALVGGGSQRAEGCAKGSWDPLGTYERQTGGRVFATALGALALEQPWRHRRLAETARRPAASPGPSPGSK